MMTEEPVSIESSISTVVQSVTSLPIPLKVEERFRGKVLVIDGVLKAYSNGYIMAKGNPYYSETNKTIQVR